MISWTKNTNIIIQAEDHENNSTIQIVVLWLSTYKILRKINQNSVNNRIVLNVKDSRDRFNPLI